MPEETSVSSKRLIAPPSASTTIGTFGGVGAGPIIVWALAAFAHVTIPPEIAASIGAFVGNLIGYFFEGGRKV